MASVGTIIGCAVGRSVKDSNVQMGDGVVTVGHDGRRAHTDRNAAASGEDVRTVDDLPVEARNPMHDLETWTTALDLRKAQQVAVAFVVALVLGLGLSQRR
jgi:hypothetical protein